MYKKYHYSGPVYHLGNKISIKSNIYTMAKSMKQAYNNFLYKVANGDITSHYDIVDTYIKEVSQPKTNDKSIDMTHKNKTCETCGYELNPLGECPICDYNEYDLLDAFVHLRDIDD